MKLRKMLCLIITIGMVMTCMAIISMPAVSAATTNTSTEFSEDFEGYTVSADWQTVIQELWADNWYLADEFKLYTSTGSVKPYSQITSFVQLVNLDNSKCLLIGTPNQNKSYSNFGLGRALPGVSATGSASGVYEINFDFKPYATQDAPVQFLFTMNTADGSASTDKTIAQHNILAAFQNNLYMGYRDYLTIYNNSVSQGKIDGSQVGGVIWYKVRAVVDCDARYYSVELYNRSTGALIARRSPISFDASETIGFLKLSALGMGKAHRVYVDNISIEKKSSRDNIIYNETFGSYTNSSYRATTAMTTSNDSTVGDSYFEGYTPWRYVSGNNFKLEENDDTLNSQVVRLGDDPETTDTTETSGLVYMQYGENIVTTATQPARGMTKLSFKIKPSTISSDVTVNVIPAASSSYDITNNNYAFFKIKNSGGHPQLVTPSGNNQLNTSRWYDVEMIFDVINQRVITKVTDTTENTTISYTIKNNGSNPAPNAVKGIMFKVDGGSSVLVDDIKLEYDRSTTAIDIKAVKSNGTAISAPSNIAANSKINVDYTYANSTDSAVNVTGIAAFYNGDMLVGIDYKNTTVAANTYGTDTTTFALDVPSGIDMSTVSKVSVFLWDDFSNITPWCAQRDFEE